MANLGSLVYRIKSNNRDFKQGMRENKREVKDLDRQVKKSQGTLRKYSRAFKQAGIALTVFGAVVTGVGLKLAKMASDANEIQSRFNHVFGEMSDDANEWAENFAESFGQSRSEVKSMMATLQDTLVPMGVATDKAYELNKQITELAIDMSSFANVPLEQAMNDIMSAIVGQSRPMRKYGSVLTETRVASYALAEGIIETDRELTEQEKILARVDLMMQDMTKAQGDYNRTQNSFANQIRETKNDIKNLAESIGQDILPIYADFLEKGRDILQWVKDLPDEMKKNIAQWTVWSGIVALIVGPLALIVGYLPQIAAGFTMIKGALAGFGPAGWVVLGFTALVGLMSDTRTEVEKLESALNDLSTAEMENRKELLKTELERYKQKVRQREESGAGELDSIASGAVGMAYEQKISDIEQKIALLNQEIDERERESDTGGSGSGGGGTGGEGTGDSERPGWIPESWPENEIDEERSKQIAQEIMMSGYEVAILEMEGVQKEIAQLDMQRKQELNQLKNRDDIGEKLKEVLRADIEEKYQIKREQIYDRYAEQRLRKEEEVMRNKFQLEEISLQEYKDYLNRRLNNYEKYSNQWMAIHQELQNLEDKPPEEKTIEDIREKYRESLDLLTNKNEIYGDSFDFQAQKAQLLRKTIDELIEAGYAESDMVEKLIERYKDLTDEKEEASGSYSMYSDSRHRAYQEGKLKGYEYEAMLENDFVNLFNQVGFSIEEAYEKFKWFRESLIDGLTKAITEGKNLTDVFKEIVDQIAAMVIKKGIVTPIVDWGLGEFGFDTAHNGGLVTVNGLESYHTGGQIGSGPLKSDERLVKTEVGEVILTEEQQRGIINSQNNEAPIILNVTAMDSQDVLRALTKDGGKAVAQALGIDYNRNGKSRSIIKGGK